MILFFICVTGLVTVLEAFCSVLLIESVDTTENINFSGTEEGLTGRPEVKQNSVCREHLPVPNR